MIKIENTSVYNFENATRGMRNPLDSWEKSDSRMKYITIMHFDEGATMPTEEKIPHEFILGENDKKLALKLIGAGTDHSKFMRQIMVSVDINSSLYWWKEFDTYKVGTVANSTSTMHTLTKKPITIDMFSIDEEYLTHSFMPILMNYLESLRQQYLQCMEHGLEEKAKSVWRHLIQILPSSFNQTRTVILNYAVLRNIYFSRKFHKLLEWREFCAWIETLPYSELITYTKEKN